MLYKIGIHIYIYIASSGSRYMKYLCTHLHTVHSNDRMYIHVCVCVYTISTLVEALSDFVERLQATVVSLSIGIYVYVGRTLRKYSLTSVY